MSSDQVNGNAEKTNTLDLTSYSGVPLKKIHVADLSDICGPRQRGLNDPVTSKAYPINDKRSTCTPGDFQRLVEEQRDPKAKNYLLRYSLQYDDNSVFVSRNYLTSDAIDLSVFMNHSCDANCASKYVDEVFALRDIEPGSVLTVDYGICITDQLKLAAFDTCRCGASSCAVSNVYARYKTPEWQNKFYEYCLPYVKRKIDEFREQQNESSKT